MRRSEGKKTSRRPPRRCASLLGVLLMPVGLALAESSPAPCDGEISRVLGMTHIQTSAASDLQTVCPTGTLERVNLTASVGGETQLSIEFQQNAFDQAIYHLDVRDAAQQPVDWIIATPKAGEIGSTNPARIELVISPPAELVSSVQAVTLGISIHDGLQGWSRDLELQITVGEEQPLFQDQFEIDPVIGQFSQRSTETRRIQLIAAQPPSRR